MSGRRISILTPFEYGGIILIALCHLPAVVSGNTTADTHSAPASGEMNLSLVCEKGKRQSPINLSSSHRSHGHHTLEFLYQPNGHGCHSR